MCVCACVCVCAFARSRMRLLCVLEAFVITPHTAWLMGPPREAAVTKSPFRPTYTRVGMLLSGLLLLLPDCVRNVCRIQQEKMMAEVRFSEEEEATMEGQQTGDAAVTTTTRLLLLLATHKEE